MAVLTPPNSASLFTFRAASWAVQVNIGTQTSPIWTFLRGISKFDPKQDPTLQDDTDIDSGGYKSQLVTAQALNIDVEGLIKGEKSASLVVPDPGTSYLRQKGKLVGYDNIVQLRYWRVDDIDEAYTHFFACNYTDVGGSNEDLQKFNSTLTGRGKPTPIAKPQATDVNEIQSITILGGPTGGDFKLKFLGQETAAIAYNAAASAVQTAIAALSNIGAGQVAVTGNVGGPWAVAFGGTLAAVDVPLLLVSNNGLTGGTTPTVQVAVVQQGAKAAA